MLASVASLSSASPSPGEQNVIDLLSDHGTTLFLAVVKGALFFGGIGMVLGFVLFFTITRRGWVDIRGRKYRIARVLFAIGLFLGCVPLIAGAGVAHYMATATVQVVRSEIRETSSVQLVGGAIVAPAVLAHLVAEDEYDEAQVTALSWQTLTESDVSFLVAEPSRKRALDALTDDLLRAALDKIPGYQEAREKPVLGFLLATAEDKAAGKVHERVASYSQFFTGVKADQQGALSFQSAASAVGLTFFDRTVEPLIRSPYHSLRLQLLIGAVLLFILVLGLIQGVGRWLTRDTAGGSPDGDT